MTAQTKKSRPLRCVVVSDKMNKSRVAKLERLVKHPVVEKYIKRTTKFMFHDEKNETKIGDVVLIEQTKPMSARKNFKLLSIVES